MIVMNEMRADARVDREASVLAASGNDVDVVALRSHGLPEMERRSGYVIRRVADYSRAAWTRPAAKIFQMRKRTATIVRCVASLAPDVVHAHDTDALAPACAAARATSAVLVYDAHELFPDMAGPSGRGRPLLVRSYWRSLERRLVPCADSVITVGDGLAEELARRYGIEAVVIRNAAPLQPLQRGGRLRRELGIAEDVPIVLYQGVLNAGRALDRLVRVVASVPGAVLVLQGSGSEEGKLREIVAAHGLADRVRLTGHVPQETLHEYACGADVGVVIYEATSLNNYYAAPNKLYAYLMAGLPIAASDFPGLREVVVDEEVGIVFDPADEASIAESIRSLLSDPDSLEEMSARARQLAETRYNWQMESRKLIDLYERLARERTKAGR